MNAKPVFTDPVHRLATCFALFVLLIGAALQSPASAQITGGTPTVLYTPSTSLMGGQIPYSRFYDLSIKSPSSVTSPVTVGLEISVTSKPSSVTTATALSYLNFSATSLTYSGPNQTQSVRITVTVPLTATPGSYGYKILATGFPPNSSGSLVNNGAFIDAAISEADVPTPPTVNIDTPVDGSTIENPSGTFPLSVPFSFSATSGGVDPTPVTQVSADLDNGTTVTLTTSGLGTTSATASGTLQISSYGAHTISATATNAAGTAADTNVFTIVVNRPPPTATIDTPAAGATYTYRAGDAPVTVPFSFTARSEAGGVRSLTAKVDGATAPFTPNGLNTPTATGSINLAYSAEGSHTLEVTASDDGGSVTANANFTINVVAPTPTIAINNPPEGQIYTVPSGQSTMNVPFSFTTTSNNGFTVDSVSAVVGTTSVADLTTTGLGTGSATSTGTMTGLSAGTYTLTASGTSAGVNASASVNFTVRCGGIVPPTVVINTPTPNATYTRVSGGAAISIPLTFTGTSKTAGGVITQLKASLGNTQLAVTSNNLNNRVANGSATLTVSNAGTYTICVEAIDAYGVANATSKFTVCVLQPRNIYGEAFFDVDFDCVRDRSLLGILLPIVNLLLNIDDHSEFGLAGVTVKLSTTSNQLLATTTTDSCGNYSFCNLPPGTYKVSHVASTGLKATTTLERTVTINGSDVCVPRTGFGLDFAALKTLTATGKPASFWKSNIDKAIKCDPTGAQVSKATLSNYTCNIQDFALFPYDYITLKSASTATSYSGSNSVSLLTKELLAAEYNYQHGAHLGGDRILTYLFLYWGEHVLENPLRYSNNYRLWAEAWFKAYNNSQGGVVNGPNL